MKRFAFFWGIIVCLSSCSIKEDRSGVPCCLKVYYDDADPDQNYKRTILATKSGDTFVSFDTLNIADFVPIGKEVFMPKGYGSLSSIVGFEQVYYQGDTLGIRSGREYDRIWAYTSSPDCRWDTGRDSVCFYKQHAVMTIKPRHPVAGYYPYNMRIRSATKGMNIYTLEPIKGDFSAFASKNRDGTLSVVLPRQYDDSMMLDIMDPNGAIEVSFKLGMMIKASGFDWNSPNLDDLTVIIDYASLGIKVVVEKWIEEDYGIVII